MEDLQEIALALSTTSLSEGAQSFVQHGRRIEKEVRCFDFVPSNYEQAWRTLDSLPRGRFCEWGSGLGIVTGLAEMLGFEACGIEADFDLCQRSRELLEVHGLKASIIQGDYFQSETRADIYYVYCWPSILQLTEELFGKIAEADSMLLICYGQDDIRGRRIPPRNAVGKGNAGSR